MGGQLAIFVLLSSFFCVLGAVLASTSPKGSVWVDHLTSGRLLLSGRVPDNPTYPMWGYSLLAGTLSDYLIWVQAVLAIIVSTWWFSLICSNRVNLGLKLGPFFPVLVSIGLIPWFGLATTYFSNSIAIILALLAVCFLWQAENTGHWLKMAALCGVNLGLAANIRSEFVVISFLLGFCVFAYNWKIQRVSLGKSLGRTLALILPVMLAMTPWAAHSYSSTGELRFKSTNSGAVAYLGLGSLPGNPWGIEPKDEYVDKLALDALGSRSAWTPAADKHFSRLFGDAIRQHPEAFVKRVANGWRVMLLQGFYLPNLRQVFFSDVRDEIVAGLAVEKMKASLSLGVDLYASDRAKKAGVDLTQLQARHIAVVVLEAMLRILGVVLLVCLLVILVYRLLRYWPYTFSGWVAATFMLVTVVVAGLIQTSPRHSTLLLPIILGAVLMGQKSKQASSRASG
jgi:hypothetical protein